MKNFEMPKMNISIFSNENVVITESAAVQAKNQLINNAGVSGDNVTVTTFDDWTNA